ncbi:hypothetical protein GF360_03420 [candidate division WWE3 bacterium]|nr:hypothetical protein [candidate division WWE3 bacterium]
MYNWSTDEKKLKNHPQKHKLWKLEQLINFGLGKERLNRKDLKRNLKKLTIDPQKKKYLQFLLKKA